MAKVDNPGLFPMTILAVTTSPALALSVVPNVTFTDAACTVTGVKHTTRVIRKHTTIILDFLTALIMATPFLLRLTSLR